MRRVLRYLSVFFLLLVVLSVAGFQGGNISSSTVNAIAFSGATAAGVSAAFQNIGQASHWLTYCPNASTATISIDLEASYDNVVFFAITPPGTTADGSCSVLEAGGYYPYVQANLVSITGGGAAVTAYYSGSSFPIPAGGIGQLGKTSQPMTMIATKITNINGLTCTTPITFSSSATVIYGMTIANLSTNTVYVLITDTSGPEGDGEFGMYVVPATSSKEVTLPTEGVQAGSTALAIRACNDTAFSVDPSPIGSINASVFFKNNPIINAKAGKTGTVSGTRKAQP